jgi:hypothetical protein
MHSICAHWVAQCVCASCWPFSAQCPTSDLCNATIQSHLLTGDTFDIEDNYSDYGITGVSSEPLDHLILEPPIKFRDNSYNENTTLGESIN